MMHEESAIIIFLEGSPDVFIARKEIARKAQKRQVFEENSHWVDAPLASLLNQGPIEQNDACQYRIHKSDILG
jgi:ABC-type uncharacterized transport system ATPase subunit